MAIFGVHRTHNSIFHAYIEHVKLIYVVLRQIWRRHCFSEYKHKPGTVRALCLCVRVRYRLCEFTHTVKLSSFGLCWIFLRFIFFLQFKCVSKR